MTPRRRGALRAGAEVAARAGGACALLACLAGFARPAASSPGRGSSAAPSSPDGSHPATPRALRQPSLGRARVDFLCDSPAGSRPVHGPPFDLTADPSTPGQVALRWKTDTTNDLLICRHEVWRRAGEDGPWELRHAAGPGEVAWVDTAVVGRTRYAYKVVSVAEVDEDHPVVRLHGVTLPADEARRACAPVGPIEARPTEHVVPISLEEARGNRAASAYVRVYKWDRAQGKFEVRAFTVAVGAPVGGRAKLRGGRELDFSTGAVLDACWVGTRRHRLGHDERVQWIRLRFADGTTVETNDRDRPAGLE